MNNAINWFEIPASNFERAVRFYSDILTIDLHRETMMGTEMAFFPSDNGVGGAVVRGDGYVPSDKGSLVYLNGGEDLSAALARVDKAGGKVIVPKTQISPEIGYFALFIDTEGNKVALHSPK
jgi:predicted enzyme related to lactoylglutathione lyase